MADHAGATYAFCLAFFSELKAAGVDNAVVSPGFRSAPLTVSADRAGLRTWVHLDERSAGFFALGMAKASRLPVVLICTSGTAAANYLPAVVEANRSGTPLIVVTADRPPESRGWGSNQTIDQARIYGTNPRWFAEMPVASEVEPAGARRFAARAAAVASASPAGPVHLNFPLRQPLSPDAEPLFEPPTVERQITVSGAASLDETAVAALCRAIAEHERGVFLAGAVNPGALDVDAVLAVASRAGWPILAEPTSQLRVADPLTSAAVISNAAHLVQDERFATSHYPEAIVLLGGPPPTRSLRRWLGAARTGNVIVIGDDPEWGDQSFTHAIRADAGRLLTASLDLLPVHGGRESWQRAWIEADEAASVAKSAALIEADMFEGRVVTALGGVLPEDVALYVGNSMAVRDVNLYWPRQSGRIDIYSNRGASGIDGMISSALGAAAATGRPVALFLGDLSFLHDLSGLLAAERLQIPLVVVVVNNDGGGIFSFLPIEELGDAVRFSDLFHTPHGTDLGSVVGGFGVAHRLVASSTALQEAVIGALDAPGPTVIEVQVDAVASVVQHRAVDAAVRGALSARS